MTLLPNRRRVVTAAAWSAVFIAHGLMVAVGARTHSLIPDEDAYLGLTRNLAAEGRYALDFPSFWHVEGQPNTYYAPGWPAALACGYAALGDSGCWVVLWLVWCMDAVLISELAASCGVSGWGRWAAVAWQTSNPVYAYYHGHLMTEPATIGFVLAVALLGQRFVSRPTVSAALGLAVIAALGHLTRTAVLIPVLAVWLVAATVLPWRRLLPLAMLAAVVHLTVISPWLYRMHEVGASPFGTEQKFGINLYTYCGAVGGDGYRPDISPVLYPPGLDELSPAERDRALSRAAFAGIAEHPADYLRTCCDRAYYLFSPTPSFVAASAVRTAGVAAASVAFFYVPLAIAVVGLAVRRPWSPACRMLVVALLGWYAFHITFHASIRQRLPSDGLVAVLALTAWVRPTRPALPEPPPG